MSKKQLKTEKKKDKIKANSSEAMAFIDYLQIKYDVNEAEAFKLSLDKNRSEKYFFKLSFIQKFHVSGNIDLAKKVINAVLKLQLRDNKEELANEIYNNFIHHVTINEVPTSIFENYVHQWIAAGRSLEDLDEKGQTPLNYALSNNRIECAALLEKNGVDLTKLDNIGFSPLHKLAQQVKEGVSEPKVIKIWCELGLPADTLSLIKDQNGLITKITPLQFAVIFDIVEVVLAFVDAGVGSTRLDNGTTVMHYCVDLDKSEMLTQLIGKCDFNLKDLNSSPPIAQALVRVNEEVVNALVAGGADLTARDETTGKTILHLLLEANCFASAALAVRVGYDSNCFDLTGKNAMDILIEKIVDGSCDFKETGLDLISVFYNEGKCVVSPENILSIRNSNIKEKDVIIEQLKANKFIAENVAPVLLDESANVTEFQAEFAVLEINDNHPEAADMDVSGKDSSQ